MNCENCGIEYRRPPSMAGRFCSKRCWYDAKPETPVAERLWRRVRKGGGDSCWEWTGCKLATGYGSIGSRSGGPRLVTHRVAWEDANGPIPPGVFVLHHCDNRACVRPSHLFLGSKADNTRDMLSKGRECSGERSPHARLTAGQVRVIRAAYRGGSSLTELARAFAIVVSQIHAIVNHRAWRRLL